MWDILWPAWLGGSLVALTAAPLGCLLVWRRLAYFSDSLAHATLLGAGLGLWLQIPVWGGVMAVSVMLSLVLAFALERDDLPSDAVLSLLSATTLSLGLMAVSLRGDVRVDLLAYLFGDLLSLTPGDLPLLGGGLALAVVILAVMWRSLVRAAIDEPLAAVEGLPVRRLRLLFLLLLALVVTVAMKAVGSLLITALLVIPALAARPLARGPGVMALLAGAMAALAVSGGLLASAQWDTPAGPGIVVSAALLFLLTRCFPQRT